MTMRSLIAYKLSIPQTLTLRAGQEPADHDAETTAKVTIKKAKAAQKTFDQITQYISS